MKKHEDRAVAFRLQAELARDRGLTTLLPSVRETQARAAAAWEALAEAEDGFLRASALRKAAAVELQSA